MPRPKKELDVDKIMGLVAEGRKQRDIAIDFNVSQATISKIIRGTRDKATTPPVESKGVPGTRVSMFEMMKAPAPKPGTAAPSVGPATLPVMPDPVPVKVGPPPAVPAAVTLPKSVAESASAITHETVMERLQLPADNTARHLRDNSAMPILGVMRISKRIQIEDFISDLKAALSKSEGSGGCYGATLVGDNSRFLVELFLPVKGK